MDNTTLKKQAKETVEELNVKIHELKSKPVADELQSKHKDIIENLERIRDHVHEIYKAYEASGDEKGWNEFGKDVYEDLKDFNDRYPGVGSYFDHI
jgi:uncharacterized protein YicC (UPF0701 family)